MQATMSGLLTSPARSSSPLATVSAPSCHELRELPRAPATWSEPDPELQGQVVRAIATEADAARVRSRRRRPAFWRRLALRRPAYGIARHVLAVVAVIVVVALNSAARAPERLAMVITGAELAPGAHGSASLTKTGSGWRINLSATGLPHLANGRYY